MKKNKPFIIFLLVTVLSVAAFFSSSVVSSYIDGKYESMTPVLATVKISDDTAYAEYTYEKIEYSSQIPYSSVLKNGTNIPVYIDPACPDKAELKDLSAALILRFVSIPMFIISLVGCIVTYIKFKKENHT